MTVDRPGSALAPEPVRQRFFQTGDALTAVEQRTDLIDAAVVSRFDAAFGEQPAGVALLAVGGYGRRQLFPCSDVDLLFLFEKHTAAEAARDSISLLLRDVWDHGARASHSVRTPGEAASLAEDNVELNISLLDARYLAGDRKLVENLLERLRAFYTREKDPLVRGLDKLTRARHAKYGDTIYHLEPNIKDGPGGLRDFQVACWLSQLSRSEAGAPHSSAWPPRPASETYLPDESRTEWLEAKRFLFALRCYLHYFNGRDNNNLTFEQQERVVAEGGGKCFAATSDVAAWMRDYFRNVRVMHRLARRVMDEVATPEHSLFTMFRDRKSRLSNSDFAVTRGRLYLRRPDALASEPALLLRFFEFIARHAVAPAPETERRISQAADTFRLHLERARRIELGLWPLVAEMLRLPHAYQALVTMRETGVLGALFPEYERIDCLVVRDFYHRYTVDEHSLRTIKTLHELRSDPTDDPLTKHFTVMMQELARPEVLFFALLFHDVGKGAGEGKHVEIGVELTEQAMERMGMAETDRESVRFLIAHHLEMSSIMTSRDLADPETARAFAAQVGTLEQLQKLTLMTYADIASVNPEALTPWRKDLLWQLYVATHNQLTREMEAERIGTGPAVASQLGSDEAERQAIGRFLEGLPTRYLRIHTPEQIGEHFRLKRLLAHRNVAVRLARRHSLYELVVLATDRPFLLASIAGTISSFAMNIVKAEAFANREGIILDTFVFEDPNRSFELNPEETERLESTLQQVLLGKIDVRELLYKRQNPPSNQGQRIPRQIAFDNETSPNETIFHVITEDRSGLLYDLASTFSFNRCDIDMVLIDTEGQKAIDVFYVRTKGRKLDNGTASQLCEKLEKACSGEEN